MIHKKVKNAITNLIFSNIRSIIQERNKCDTHKGKETMKIAGIISKKLSGVYIREVVM